VLKYLKYPKRKKTSGKVEWKKASDVELRLTKLISKTELGWVNKGKIYTFRSSNSKARAYARIWGLSRIWQQALKTKPQYIIEVISERFDKLSEKQKDEILLHELAHIPKNFSGSLVPHFRKGKRKFHDKVKKLISSYNKL